LHRDNWNRNPSLGFLRLGAEIGKGFHNLPARCLGPGQAHSGLLSSAEKVLRIRQQFGFYSQDGKQILSLVKLVDHRRAA
jgi:hypothetical protein